MIASIVIGLLIFGYAAWTLYRHVKRSQEGKCSGCSVAKTCQSASCGSGEPITLPKTHK